MRPAGERTNNRQPADGVGRPVGVEVGRRAATLTHNQIVGTSVAVCIISIAAAIHML